MFCNLYIAILRNIRTFVVSFKDFLYFQNVKTTEQNTSENNEFTKPNHGTCHSQSATDCFTRGH